MVPFDRYQQIPSAHAKLLVIRPPWLTFSTWQNLDLPPDILTQLAQLSNPEHFLQVLLKEGPENSDLDDSRLFFRQYPGFAFVPSGRERCSRAAIHYTRKDTMSEVLWHRCHATMHWSTAALGFLSALLLSGMITAQQPDGGIERYLSDDPVVLPETVVRGVRPAFDPIRGSGSIFGDREGLMDAPGSGALLDLEILRTQSYDNPNRVLSQVPGVYLREEDGFGNFPNISLRGVDMARSAKVTIMEDGILAAPAAYSAPSAYYFPTVGRMFAVEVFKGSSQVQFGPHSTGGAINFLSTPIPERQAFYLRTVFGTNNEMRVHAWAGDTWLTEHG